MEHFFSLMQFILAKMQLAFAHWKLQDLIILFYWLILYVHNAINDYETCRWECLYNSQLCVLTSRSQTFFFSYVESDSCSFCFACLFSFSTINTSFAGSLPCDSSICLSFIPSKNRHLWHLISLLINTSQKELQPLEHSRSSWLSM